MELFEYINKEWRDPIGLTQADIEAIIQISWDSHSNIVKYNNRIFKIM